jgi:hypothetical protein
MDHEEVLTGSQSKAASETILTIVSSQRDRFRQRNLELEAESRHQAQTITTLRNEVDTVRSDNIKLYEKIKFLQGYQGPRASGGAAEVDETLGRYSSEYEEHINPFKQFNRQEKHRKYLGMTALDKITFQIVSCVCVCVYVCVCERERESHTHTHTHIHAHNTHTHAHNTHTRTHTLTRM